MSKRTRKEERGNEYKRREKEREMVRERGRGGREKKTRKSERTRSRERERYYKSEEKGKLQLLNDHPVHSYLPWIGFPFPLRPSQFRFTLFSLPNFFAVSVYRWVPVGPLSVIAFLNSMLVAYVVE